MRKYKLSLLKCKYHPQSRDLEYIRRAIRERCDNNFPEGLQKFNIDIADLSVKLPEGAIIEEKTVPAQNKGENAFWIDVLVPWINALASIEVCIDEICRKNLYLIDWQNNEKIWCKGDFINTAPFLCRERCNALLSCLQKAGICIRNIVPVEDRFGLAPEGEYLFKNKALLSYSLILRRNLKDNSPPINKRVEIIYHTLLNALVDGEKLECRERSFVVTAYTYQISFVVEGYNKNPTLVWHMDNGAAVSEPLRRMNSNMAIKRARKKYGPYLKNTPLWRRVGLLNMIKSYPNPADRFVASVKLDEKLNRMKMGIIYDAPGFYHGTTLNLQNIPSHYMDFEEKSQMDCLYIWDDAFSFILPFIQRRAGGNFEYYSCVNPLHYEIWEKIIDDMHIFAKMVLHGQFSGKVSHYFMNMSTYILSNSDHQWNEDEDELIYANRKRIYDFYNFICDWLEENLSYYANIINISGL